MKKLILISLFVLLFPVIASATAFERNLYFGLRNDADVSKLQEFLTTEGIYSGPITGNFFSLTLKAVKDFQTREGISPVAGYFGPLTRTKANSIIDTQISASSEQAVSETGQIPITPETPVEISDVVKTLQDQIALLLQQVNLLQSQLTAQQSTQQEVVDLKTKVEQQTRKIEEQTAITQQIQQQTQVIKGCIIPRATNYNPLATQNDGSCVYPVIGCMDETALNYSANATKDDGGCKYLVPDTTAPKIAIYNQIGDSITFTTDEPTRAKIYYFALENNPTLQSAYQLNQNDDYLSPILRSEGTKMENLSVWSDDSLKTQHGFQHRGNVVFNKTFFYSIYIEDASGNSYQQPWQWGRQFRDANW